MAAKQRRLAAIMFTDLVGYSALTQENEALALDLLEEHRAILRPFFPKRGGQEIKTIGDAFLVEFASAVEAVECAVEIQSALAERNKDTAKGRPIRLRIGIHVGDILRDGDDVLGDGVNIASRLEPLAEPGGICISEQVYFQVRKQVQEEIVSLGKKTLKNIQEPLGIYKLNLGRDADVSITQSPSSEIPSIAVLPFKDMSPDKDQDYFCEGIAEELLNALVKVEELQVAARTSAFQFKGKDQDIRKIGHLLNVKTVLEGSVRKAGNRLRITAQLINVDDGYHLWSERYDREMEDIFAIQDEIALAIVKALEVTLKGKTSEPLVKHHTKNSEAYGLYLKGVFHWNSLTAEGWARSLECYKRAIEIDPAYALAYGEISSWHLSQTFWGDVPPDKAFPKALQAAERALELDDKIAIARTCLAVILYTYERNWAEAEHEFRQALDLDPKLALTHVHHALFLGLQGRLDEALSEAILAKELDPLSSPIRTWSAAIYTFRGEHEENIKELLELIESDPGYWLPYYHLAHSYLAAGMIEEAIAAGNRAVELSGGAASAVTILICATYSAGEVDKADEMFQGLLERSSRSYVAPSYIAWIYLARGESDEALTWLEKALEVKDPWICFLGVMSSPDLEDPGIVSILKRIGLRN